jgi:hypothetical protein
MVRHLQRRVREIEQRVRLGPGDLVLDIGSNDGTLLSAYSAPNLRRVGVDPLGGKFRRYYPGNAELIDDFFSAPAVRRLVGSQDVKVVSSIAMFYDLEDPMRFVEDILEVLGDDGIWVFEQSYLPSMLATCSYDTVCHEHLEYYALRQVVYFAQRLGLKILDVDINEINGGSFCVTASKIGSPFPEAEDLVGRILADEKAAGLDTTQPFERFQCRIRKHRQNLLDLLKSAAARGEKVFGYGASTKGNVLLQYCGIDSTFLPVIAEVNEDKFGAFTPGTQIPIVSEQDAKAMLPDYFLVLP